MFRFFIRAVPLIVLLLFLFSLTIPFLDAEGASSLAVLTVTRAPLRAVVGMWLLEAFGLIGIFLLVEGRSRLWWLDALLASWVAWIFRGPLLAVTLVLAAGKPQAPWFRLVVGWWVLYSVCGLFLGYLARYQAAAAARAAAAAEAEAVEAEAIEAADARVAAGQAGQPERAEPEPFTETAGPESPGAAASSGHGLTEPESPPEEEPAEQPDAEQAGAEQAGAEQAGAEQAGAETRKLEVPAETRDPLEER